MLKEGRELFDFNHKYNKYPHKIYLSSPTMHGPELNFIKEAYESNWVSTVGENISECERLIADVVGRRYGVGLSFGTINMVLLSLMMQQKVLGRHIKERKLNH